MLAKINEAYEKIMRNKAAARQKGNEYKAIVDSIEIRIRLSGNDKVITAFPFL